ncbi:MAG: ChaN family lipoprotein [Bacteroidia bacterium]
MKKRTSWVLFLCLIYAFPLMSQEKPAYRIFDQKGKEINYGKMLRKLSDADVICFGESHNNPIAHWLEFELTRDLHKNPEGKNLVVGMEMFERNQQARLEQYLRGDLTDKQFQDSVDLWNNYETDYRPVVDYCKENNIAVIGTNIPRRYARIVYSQGLSYLDTLPQHERVFIAPIPITIDYNLPSYQAMKSLMGGHQMDEEKLKSFISAQAVKDATMAHSILENMPENTLFFHMNGSYHSDSKEGIIWYLNHYRPGLNIMNITLTEQASTTEVAEENKGKADFYIVVPEDMTKTY